MKDNYTKLDLIGKNHFEKFFEEYYKPIGYTFDFTNNKFDTIDAVAHNKETKHVILFEIKNRAAMYAGYNDIFLELVKKESMDHKQTVYKNALPSDYRVTTVYFVSYSELQLIKYLIVSNTDFSKIRTKTRLCNVSTAESKGKVNKECYIIKDYETIC